MAEEPKANGSGSKVNGTSLPKKKGRASEIAQESRGVKRPRASLSRGPAVKLDIPQPPAPADPHVALFIWGTGDMGQLGLGPDALDDIKRPKLHSTSV
jgi:regulator of chromosome condensation